MMAGIAKRLADEIIAGRRLRHGDELAPLVGADLDELRRGADAIRMAIRGDRFEFCSIINGRGGRCGEDCKFCAQSSRHATDADEHDLLPTDEIVADALRIEGKGVMRYSIVTAGRGIHGDDFDALVEAYRALRERTKMALCASHGFQTEEELRRLKAVGVQRYHANIETSRRYFPMICTTHTFDDKLENIARAKRAGLGICSGGILGMGESWEDRIDMALTLAEIGAESIPINFLIPIPGTPFAEIPAISHDDALRSVAIFRYAAPEAWIRIAAGRSRSGDGGECLFRSGADSAITGDMLTSAGVGIDEDMRMAVRMGWQIQ